MINPQLVTVEFSHEELGKLNGLFFGVDFSDHNPGLQAAVGKITTAANDLSAIERLFSIWTDTEARLGGVVAAGSECDCGASAQSVLESPRWGAWDVCGPCGSEQLAVLHGGDWTKANDLDQTKHQALKCIQLDATLRA